MKKLSRTYTVFANDEKGNWHVWCDEEKYRINTPLLQDRVIDALEAGAEVIVFKYPSVWLEARLHGAGNAILNPIEEPD